MGFWKLLCLLSVASSVVVCGCKSSRVLDLYYQQTSARRLDDASGYIAFLKQTRFTHGELDGLPRNAIIFYGDVREYLRRLGFSEAGMTSLKLGTADPTVLIIVHADGSPFMIEQGLPGGGGVTTQEAELVALGASHLLHVGTCGALNDSGTAIFLGTASFKDGAAVLLSNDSGSGALTAEADDSTRTGLAAVLNSLKIPWTNGIGFTMPLFYLQPEGIYERELLNPSSRFRSDYVEMEQAAFFEMARVLKVRAGSLVVPSDRMCLKNGHLVHVYLSQDQVQEDLEHALRASIRFFEEVDHKKPTQP
jgi:uridine phosphorylase